MDNPRRRIFSLYLLPILAIGALAIMFLHLVNQPERADASPTISPSESDYNLRVAGTGIVEPKSEIIKISSNLPGIITNIYVEPGRKVAAGDKLFTIDEREAKSALATAIAAHEAAKAKLNDEEYKLSLYRKLEDKRAVSEQEISAIEYAVQIARAEARQEAARIQEVNTTLDRLTVKAPIDGEILRVNTRPGEYAPAGIIADPLITMGNTETMYVRVEIDETDAQRFHVQGKAKASLRGKSEDKVSLDFVRVEPMVAPKRNLTGSSFEKVDTRILEVLYSFDNTKIKAYPGQQMDVYVSNE